MQRALNTKGDKLRRGSGSSCVALTCTHRKMARRNLGSSKILLDRTNIQAWTLPGLDPSQQNSYTSPGPRMPAGPLAACPHVEYVGLLGFAPQQAARSQASITNRTRHGFHALALTKTNSLTYHTPALVQPNRHKRAAHQYDHLNLGPQGRLLTRPRACAGSRAGADAGGGRHRCQARLLKGVGALERRPPRPAPASRLAGARCVGCRTRAQTVKTRARVPTGCCLRIPCIPPMQWCASTQLQRSC